MLTCIRILKLEHWTNSKHTSNLPWLCQHARARANMIRIWKNLSNGSTTHKRYLLFLFSIAVWWQLTDFQSCLQTEQIWWTTRKMDARDVTWNLAKDANWFKQTAYSHSHGSIMDSCLLPVRLRSMEYEALFRHQLPISKAYRIRNFSTLKTNEQLAYALMGWNISQHRVGWLVHWSPSLMQWCWNED